MEPLVTQGGVHSIVAHASASNALTGITGALIYSGTRFAQVLEGPDDAVEALFRRIRDDNRHVFEAAFDCEPIAYREFKTWSLCYAGPSVFVARSIAEFARAARSDQRASASRIIALIAGLARA